MITSDVVLYQYALSLLGSVYKWAGSNPMEGFDCSGLVVELLQAAGTIPEYSDYTAQSLYHKYKGNQLPGPRFGALSFYGSDANKVSHVGFCLNSYLMIEAGGGGASTIDITEAISRDAFVRIRPVTKGRRDGLGIFMPPYLWKETHGR